MNIGLEQAEAAIRSAKEKAGPLNLLINVTIVDTGVRLVAFACMDDECISRIDIALRKARTTEFFNKESRQLGKISQLSAAVWKLEHSNDGLITFAGGISIRNEAGEIIGGIRVSGSMVEYDHAGVQAGGKAVVSK